MMSKIHTTKYRVIGVYINLVLLAFSLFIAFGLRVDSLRFWGLYGFFVSAILFILYAAINQNFFVFYLILCFSIWTILPIWIRSPI